MRNKILVVLLVSLTLVHCGKGYFQRVRVSCKNANHVDFTRYKQIYYKDFSIDFNRPDFKPAPVIKNYFIKEFAHLISKKIESYPAEFKPGELAGDTLVITGRLKLDIVDRSVIGKVKDTSGKKKKGFIKIQNWSIELDIEILNPDREHIIYRGQFKDKLNEVEDKDYLFNFKTLYYQCTDRFLRRVMRKVQINSRFLLLK